ncbi:MAG: glycosyltransferase [Chloroflexi bacterium]|nr:MAG: glycosyltransferase [Chloroflexota bacterium]
MKTIDIAVPVFNEADGIEQFHRALLAELDRLVDRYQFRIIYVLDRSTDGTLDILRRLADGCAGMRVVHLSRRFGHQRSLVAAIDQSSGNALIMMDSDLQHPPAVIPELLARFEQGFDVVQTVRRYSGNTSWFKRQTSRLFYALQNALSPLEIKDGMADFRLISQRVVHVFQTNVREQHPFLRGLFQWVGFNRCEVPFVSAERAAGKTKYRLRRLIAFSVAGIISFSKVPLRFATITGFSISVLGALYAAWLLVQYVRVGGFPAGYASLIMVTLLLGGLQLMFLGVLGEYLGSIFDEVKRRPLYVVDEVIEGRRR